MARALKELGARHVLVGEDSVLGPSRVAFHAMGLFPYIDGVATPVYFDEARHVRVDVEDSIVQGSFVVPAVWPAVDMFVSLPKIKVNQFATVSVSVKNLGFLRQDERCRNHSDGTLHEKIADLYRVRPPDLVLADSIVAGEGQGPMMARPVALSVMVGGTNGIAVDAVACRLMGVNPFEVGHLRYLEEAGIGPLGDHEIEVAGEKVEDVARCFDLPSTSFEGLSSNLRVFMGADRCCAFGCRGMVRCALDGWVEGGSTGLREMNIIVGRPIPDLPRDLDPRRTIVVGNCAVEH